MILIKKFYNSHFDPSLDLRVQVFHLLAFAGIATGITAMISSLVTNAGTWSIILNSAATVTGLSMLLVACRRFLHLHIDNLFFR